MYDIINGVKVYLTEEEIRKRKAEEAEAERRYWSQSYDDLVNEEIRKKYTASAEFALLRQKDEKPEEYKAYFDYCEQCKAYVKEQQAKYAVL